MTENETIVAASREAANGTPDEAGITLMKADYRRRRNNLFMDKKWVFLLQFYNGGQLSKVTDDRNILMPYKYRFPSSATQVVDVLDVNIDRYSHVASLSPQEALDIGYSVFPENGAYTHVAPNFAFIDGVLYSDREVENVVVKNEVVERDLDAEVLQLLVLDFAVFIASNIKQDIDKARELKAERKQQYAKAAYRTIRNTRDPYSDLVRSWYTKFYTGLNY